MKRCKIINLLTLVFLLCGLCISCYTTKYKSDSYQKKANVLLAGGTLYLDRVPNTYGEITLNSDTLHLQATHTLQANLDNITIINTILATLYPTYPKTDVYRVLRAKSKVTLKTNTSTTVLSRLDQALLITTKIKVNEDTIKKLKLLSLLVKAKEHEKLN